MSRKRYSISYLAGHGIGAEITAQASRVAAAAAAMHGFTLDDEHVAFGSDAFVRYGNPFPPASRRAVAASDAVLVPADDGGALDALEAELDLQASVVRVRVDDRTQVTLVAPIGEGHWDWTVERAFELASNSRARLTMVRADDRPRRLAAAAALESDGIAFERVGLGDAVRRLVEEPRGMDVLLCRPEDVATAAEVAGCTSPTRVAAWGRVGPRGPGVFGPAHGRRHGDRRPGRRRPALDDARRRADARRGTRRARRGGDRLGRRRADAARGQRPLDRELRRPRAGRAAAEPAVRVRRRCGMKMTGADAILRSLEAEGVEVVFGLPGGAILPTYDAFAKGTTIRHVLARHEQGAGHMAEGYARASGRVGVAIATSGPGATNLVTPIADAWMDSTPLVCITGQVRSHLIGTDAFQECDITGITIPVVKHSWLVSDVREIPGVIKAAFHVASTGRCGPVLVDIPRDVQEAEIDFEYPAHVDLPGWRPPKSVHRKQVQEAAKTIAAAERPILYVGGGVLNAHATDELRDLAEIGRLPVVTTLMAKGAFPESHALFFGWPGMHGPKWSNWALNKADVVVAVGARFDDRVTGKLSAFAPGATVVHLDIDAAEIDKLRHADVPVVGPLKDVLAELTRAMAELRRDGATEPWLAQIAAWREEFPLRYDSNGGGMLKPQLVLETLRDLAAAGDQEVVWTTGVGQHQMWAMQYLECDTPRSFITSGGLGTMGYGIPAAIGAKAARPDATVVCVDGDGCFQMTCQELATAVLEQLPIVIVIVNNGHLGMVRQWQDMFFDERFSQVNLTHHVPDYAALADAYGAKGFVAEDEDHAHRGARARHSRADAPRWSTAASTPPSIASR